ncbi:hypothetical protein ACFXDJ_06335 [Streptomyces sp. NPDC059443]|uniref:hypothetical protein n=1 Tax=unclassified Streptomyces TaxID=2593676 RepID=UPI0036C27880
MPQKYLEGRTTDPATWMTSPQNLARIAALTRAAEARSPQPAARSRTVEEQGTRTINRLRAQLSGIFPSLERALDLTNKGPLTLLTGYQIPGAIRRLGAKRMETWLRNRKILRADQLAETAVEAAERQHTSLPGDRSHATPARSAGTCDAAAIQPTASAREYPVPDDA